MPETTRLPLSTCFLLACHVAVSWTWVIGMFLPVLLVRDFGLLGWVAFAVPNVIGAAAVGWVMTSARASAAFTVRHATAVGVFSAVTIVLQTFTLTWLTTRLVGGSVGLPLGLAVSLLPLVARRVGPSLYRLAPWIWLASLLAGSVMWSVDALGLPAVGSLRMAELWPLLGLAAVCGLGFLTCPLLDVSLQSTRQMSGDRGKLVFGVGFGVMFLTMILLTLGYATVLPGLLIAEFTLRSTAGVAAIAVTVHLALQVAFTNIAHLDALSKLADATERPGLQPGTSWVATSLACALLGWSLAVKVPIVVADGTETLASLFRLELLGYSYGEIIYRSLLAFYGLLFPVYLLVPTARSRVVVALLALGPIAVGFFGGNMAWALLGVVVVVAGTLVMRQVPAPHNAAEVTPPA